MEGDEETYEGVEMEIMNEQMERSRHEEMERSRHEEMRRKRPESNRRYRQKDMGKSRETLEMMSGI